jgi:LacI family transcriptional regulator
VTTIKDVADRAGVGVGTVSRVLNDHPSVTAETRARVRAAIEILDYEPNRAARALSRQRSSTIAVVVPFFTQPSAVERLRGVLAAVDDSPYELVLFSMDHGEHRRARLARLLRGDLADGLLLLSLRIDVEEGRRLAGASTPTVLVDVESRVLTTVVVDDVEGGRMAARHLLDLGHRRIAYIGDEVDPRFGLTSSARRLQGLRAELEAAGCPLRQQHVRHGPHGREVAHQLALELLGQRQRPTAVFAHADTQALGVLEAAEELRLRVPDDVSVIGFDDIESARYAGLSTVRQPLFESGRLGAAKLLERLAGKGGSRERVELPLEVVARRTTGPVRGDAFRAPAMAGATGGAE